MDDVLEEMKSETDFAVKKFKGREAGQTGIPKFRIFMINT